MQANTGYTIFTIQYIEINIRYSREDIETQLCFNSIYFQNFFSKKNNALERFRLINYVHFVL